MTTQQAERIAFLDYLKAFAIFLVILGHSVQYVSASQGLQPLYDFIYSFHMPMFMTVSGFFLANTFRNGIKGVVVNRARSLLLPVLSFSVAVFLLSILSPIDFTNGDSFFGYLASGDMWFLKYLFACTFMAYVFRIVFKNDVLAAIFPTVILIMVSRVGLFRLLPFLWLGYFLRKHALLWTGRKAVAFASFLLFVVMLFFWKLEYDFPHYRILTFSGGFAFSASNFAIVLFRFLIGAVGSIFFIGIFSVIAPDRPIENTAMRFMRNCGARTLGIYCLQIYLLEDLFGRLQMPFYGELSNLAIVLIVAVAEFLLCAFIVYLFERNKYTSLLFLGKKVK